MLRIRSAVVPFTLSVAVTVAATACAAAAPTPVCPDGGAVAAQTEGRPAPSGPTAASLGAPNAPAPGAKFAFQETPGLTLLPGCTATPSEGGSGPSPRAMAPEAIADALTDVGLAAFRAELRKGSKELFLPIAAAAASGFRIDSRRAGWGAIFPYDGGPLLEGLVAGTGRSADGRTIRFGASAGFAFTTSPVTGVFGAASDPTVSNVRVLGTCAPPATSEGGAFATADFALEAANSERGVCVNGEARGITTAHGAFVRRDLPGTPYTLVVATARKGEEAAFLDDLYAAPIQAALRAPVADGGFEVCFRPVRGTTTTTLSLAPVGGLRERPSKGAGMTAVRASYAIGAPTNGAPRPNPRDAALPSGPVGTLVASELPIHPSDTVYGGTAEAGNDAYLFVVTRANGRVEAALAQRK